MRLPGVLPNRALHLAPCGSDAVRTCACLAAQYLHVRVAASGFIPQATSSNDVHLNAMLVIRLMPCQHC